MMFSSQFPGFPKSFWGGAIYHITYSRLQQDQATNGLQSLQQYTPPPRTSQDASLFFLHPGSFRSQAHRETWENPGSNFFKNIKRWSTIWQRDGFLVIKHPGSTAVRPSLTFYVVSRVRQHRCNFCPEL